MVSFLQVKDMSGILICDNAKVTRIDMSDEQTSVPDQTPKPEVLTVTGVSAASSTDQGGTEIASRPVTPTRRVAYRPSHKATFIGLGVISAILVVNIVIIMLVMRNQTAVETATAKNGVTISTDTLDKLGVSRNPLGASGTELIVGPKATFKSDVQVAGQLQVAGQFTLNSKLNAADASFTKLQAGDAQVQQLNVNGDGTVSSLSLRKDLQVAGTTRLQGALTVNQLTTINNNMNVAGNLSIGGTLSVRNFQITNFTIAGHLISSGSAPYVVSGGAVGSNGTVAISGNDTTGTISVNTGVGAGNGLLASVSFSARYASTPHIVVSSIGHSVPGLYISNRTSAGFTINVDGAMSPGGYAFDYVVVE